MQIMNRLLLRLRSLCAHLVTLGTCYSQTVTSDKWRVVRFATALVVLTLATSHSPQAFGQAGDASISGLVSDPSGRVVEHAQVTIKNVGTNVVAVTVTNDSGIYTFPSLPPGNYVLTIRKQGFQSVDLVGLTLYTQDRTERNFTLSVGSASESVTVSGGTTNESPAVSMTVSREFIENMPLNGQSLQDLIQLAPGTVSSSDDKGYYNIDGQRTDANIFTVDGVSANLGGVWNSAGNRTEDAGLSGDSPSQTMLGTTQSMVSVDALQEFTIQTSGYTAEYGRSPGGQVQLTTRSGSNDVHGSVFDYLRNTVFDANSWSNDHYGDSKGVEHQNDFGGTIGGPFRVPKLYDGRERTFYFISYEGLRLLIPNFEGENVPTQAFRAFASSLVQPYLNSLPLPNTSTPGDKCTVSGTTINVSGSAGPTSSPCDALFAYGYSNPSDLDNISVRVDQNFSQRIHGFVRYADTPSNKESRTEGEVTAERINTHTWTAGLTWSISSVLLHELRFNFSHDVETSQTTLQSINGSTPFARNLLIPAAYDTPYSVGEFRVSVPGTSLSFLPEFAGFGTLQHQYQAVDSIAWTKGRHSLKFGGDWRRLTPAVFASTTYESLAQLTGSAALTAIQQGYATSMLIQAASPGTPVFDNLSLYVQDHWKVFPRFSVDYGIRWEFNPPPGPSNGFYPFTLTSSNLSTATIAAAGTSPYETRFDHFAPRVGFAWNALPSTNHAVTIRGGFGIFFDTGQQTIATAYYDTAPFLSTGPTQRNVPLPLTSAVLAPPALNDSPAPPYPNIGEVVGPNLTLPYTEQWNLSIDQELSSKNTLTVNYVGNVGRKLLFTGYYGDVPGNSNFPYGLIFSDNGSQSSYNALQVQDQGRIINGLNLVGSFTWAHALDSASTNIGTGSFPIYGNSDNDLRRALNLALNYQIAGSAARGWRELTQGWLLANRFSAQSGYPLSIYETSNVPQPDGQELTYYPDLVPGAPIYLHNASGVPHGWELNRAAFACTTTGATSGSCTGTPTTQGDLGRNYIRGPGFWAWNTSMQRVFPVYERLHLAFRVDAFNLLNHPNLSLASTTLSNSFFGQLGAGVTTIGVNNQLYAMGAPRSLQFSLKFQF